MCSELFKNSSILDIGCGDGETLAQFVKVNCINLTGIDLNEEMLESAKKKFGEKVKLLKVDATKLDLFEPNEFEIIISALCIHNIPRTKRKDFWKDYQGL